MSNITFQFYQVLILIFLSSILGLENDLNLKSCLLSNVSICAESDKDEFTVLIYNPLARTTSHYIQIPVNDGTWKVTGPSGNINTNIYMPNITGACFLGDEIENHLTNPIRDFSYINKVTGDKILPKVLFFRAEDLPALGYKVYKFEKVSTVSSSVREEVMAVDQMGFGVKFYLETEVQELEPLLFCFRIDTLTST